MTLEESLQNFDRLMEEERELMKDIQTNHIHNENDELVFYRYKNGKNEFIRKHIVKGIEAGKTEWESLLKDFPLPDKPFNIEDIEDIEMKERFMRLQKIENEFKELGDYINNYFGNTDMKNRIKKHFDEKYNLLQTDEERLS